MLVERDKLINTIKTRLSKAESNPVGRKYKADELVAVFSNDYSFLLAYTEVVEPRYSSWDFKLRAIYGDSLIDKAIDPINPDYMKRSLRWYSNSTFSDVTLKNYWSIDVSELVPSRFLYDGMIYDGDLLKLHHTVMLIFSMNPDIFDSVGANVLNRKKNILFISIYETIGNMPSLSQWPQVSNSFFSKLFEGKNRFPRENERDVRDMLGLFAKDGSFRFVMTEYGSRSVLDKYMREERQSFWYLENAIRQNIISRTEEEYSEKPKQIPIWLNEEIREFLGMPIAASKIIPPQVIRDGRFISVDNLKQIEKLVNNLLYERPELLEAFFGAFKKSNPFDVLHRDKCEDAKSYQDEEPDSEELAFYYRMLKNALEIQDQTSIEHWNNRIKESKERKKYINIPQKKF